MSLPTPINPDELIEQAAMYALGLLPGEEHDAFEDRVRAGDADVAAALRAVRPAADALLRATASGAAFEPRLIVRSDLINALGLKKDAPPFSEGKVADPFSEDLAGMVLLRGSNIGWTETGVPGARMKSLYVDKERQRASVLLQLDPGTVFADHDHPDVEECLVLEGDIDLGGKTMHKFDYMRIPKGGQHGTPRTRNGCLLLVTTGLAA
jgi:quercetin dioxygenase-like cupin family protein